MGRSRWRPHPSRVERDLRPRRCRRWAGEGTEPRDGLEGVTQMRIRRGREGYGGGPGLLGRGQAGLWEEERAFRARRWGGAAAPVELWGGVGAAALAGQSVRVGESRRCERNF